ncbi:MAG: single-stranded DNA-binding protein [Ferruginibacter sp.]
MIHKICIFKFVETAKSDNGQHSKYNDIMRGVNRVMLIGNLGKDPDIQFLEGNIAVAKFSLATTETYKDRSGKLISQTEWHTVVLWRGLAELAQKYLHRGSLVYIEGRLQTRSWEDKEGNKKFATEVVGDNLIMLDKRNESGQPLPGFDKIDNIENMGPSDADLPSSTDENGEERLPF